MRYRKSKMKDWSAQLLVTSNISRFTMITLTKALKEVMHSLTLVEAMPIRIKSSTLTKNEKPTMLDPFPASLTALIDS